MFTTLNLVTPPVIEPVSVELARKHCRIDNHDDDDLLGMYIQSARVLAENYLSRALITQTQQYSISRTPLTGGWPLTLTAPIIYPLWMPFEMFFNRPIELPRSPVQSITSVAISKNDGTSETLVLGDYSVDAGISPARVLIGRDWQPLPEQDTTITYVAGYGDKADSVPQVIRTAILFTTAWLYEHRGDEADEMPDVAYALMSPYRLVSFGA